MKNNLLIFGTKNFNNSLYEVKEYLSFSLLFFNKDTSSKLLISDVDFVLIDSDVCNDMKITDFINNIKNKPSLLLIKQGSSSFNKLTYDKKINLPLSLIEISDNITNIMISKKFKQNSTLQIRGYIVDKNERKLIKNKSSITITEREIELIELLSTEKKPLSKNIILKKVWKYADNVDTHTIETHIYRLRKKILVIFKDANFITNSKFGYSILK
tara:strand:+ start:14196 stop:14837 length:642 start_codon:yes stop_codon:yes gene_type:complete